MPKQFIQTLMVLLIYSCGSLPGKSEEGDNGPEMRPGENCNACHSFSISGTVFGAADAPANAGTANATVRITDRDGKTINLTSNRVGNFYTSEPLTFPVTAKVSHNGTTQSMVSAATNGGCASCHSSPGLS